MLLLDDEAELPDSPSAEEAKLAESLGEAGIKAIDEQIFRASGTQWLKVARVIHGALDAGAFDITKGVVDLHARRVIALVGQDKLAARGNLRKPRFSEVKV